MDLFRNILGSGSTSNEAQSIAETIETVVDRLRHSTLLDDRRDACRHLRGLSNKFRLEVGVQALDVLTEDVLITDRNDEQIISNALETICNILDPETHEDDDEDKMGCNFTDIYLKKKENVNCVLELLGEYEFKIRRPSAKLLTFLLQNRPREMQDIILLSHMGVSRFMDVLADTREVLRNDALILLFHLTQGNANLQKIVAFENCFDILLDILCIEGYSDGGIIVEDCLKLMLNLLRNNPSNQTFFREGSYIQKACPFFEQIIKEKDELGWSAQKVTNTVDMLHVIRTLVSPSNSSTVVSSCQIKINGSGLLNCLCEILMDPKIPADILTETINTISEVIRGNLKNQKVLSKVVGPCEPPRPALILLLMSMTSEKQPLSLRCAVLYCFQCFLHNNPLGKIEIFRDFPPNKKLGVTEMTFQTDIFPSELLFSGLLSNNKLSIWFSSVAIAHVLTDNEALKLELLYVDFTSNQTVSPVYENGSTEFIPFLARIFEQLQHTNHPQSKIGIIMLLSTWICNCSKAVTCLLDIQAVIPFLTGQITSNEHDEKERVAQGMCAFLLGLSIINIQKSDETSYQKLLQLIKSRIGHEVFMDKFNEVTKYEGYNRALNHPQLRIAESSNIIFDYMWCKLFKQQEHKIISHLENLSSSEDPSEAVPTIDYQKIIDESNSKLQSVMLENAKLRADLSETKEKMNQMQLSANTFNPNHIDKPAQCSCDKVTNQLRDELIQQRLQIVHLNSLLEVEKAKLKELHEDHEDTQLMIEKYDEICTRHNIQVDFI
ncbi:general vesicular transport factor p115 [Lepeophtheirus salmonis]|uniref:Vesicle docking protein P115like [Tribolium castaneum] n=1 Tax=Lepeophtheirus salmonis TaxID=72036 RepID=A0A0K2TCG2_LEPSM|nr:general vesicular transport factor p115-like [Lepeophtheirus salmonis]